MIKNFLDLLRVEQWYKNLLVFVAIFFSFQFLNFGLLFRVIIGFLILCIASSAIYLINDLNDIERDRLHKEKKNRPLASGKISKLSAKFILFILIFLSLFFSILLDKMLFIFVSLFFINSILYTFYFKRIAIIDIESISFNYVIRTLIGAFLINVLISSWLLLFVFTLSMFLVIGKRKSDLSVYEDINLGLYKSEFLNNLVIIFAGCVIIFYSLYTFLAHKNYYMMCTIPIIIFLTLRFLYFVSINDKKSRRAEGLFKDVQFLSGLILWFFTTLMIIYLTR